jgi:choline monooxygenase
MDTAIATDPRDADIARRLRAALPELMRPTAEAKGLPAWIYTDPDFFALERKRIFAGAWLGIAYESDVPNPGDAMAAEYAGWRFIVVRDEDRKIRCFYNVCRHRGMTLLDPAARTQGRTVACPWHRWTYDLEGRLVATPNIAGTGEHDCAGFERGALGLMAVRTDAWLGVVFVNIDGAAPPLADYLRPTAERLAAFDLSLTRESDEALETAFAGNWKLAIEGGVEDYHIPFVHKQLGPSGDFRGEFAGDRWVGVTCRRSMEVAKRRYDETGGASLPLFPHFPATGDFEASIILSTLPATLVAAVTDHAVVSLFIPESPGCTKVRRRFRFLGEAASDPGYAAARRRVRDVWAVVTEQDAPLIKAMQEQAALKDELGFRPRYSPYWEPAVHHFQKVIASKITGTPLG